jgi:uncharacterized protein YkwD
MLSVKTVSVLAIVAGAALAAPTPAEKGASIFRRWGGHGYHWWSDSEGSGTLTIPAGWSEPGAATTVVTIVTETPAAAPAVEPEATTTWAAAVTTPTPSPAADASTSTPTISSDTGTDDYMSVVSKWRAAGGLPAVTQDSTLEANALKTSTNSVGGLIHELNPGTMAQVLAPGTTTNFEEVYVGGWLCEVPSSPGLDGICATASAGWDYDGQTGHNAILTSTAYTKVGCAIASNTNVWACDWS